ncbi:hypothetical protein [Paracoccus benzoatiresistens]|uniref:Glycosyltransferase RgtA/B/C/D-like domain-containing protein n=1 Tax=Paracoccus benzoatiresistens TaxID=2997341 RepID=A0ABT4J0K2_9RHOB|nr:hypothetical protein [Paracoccus sp. EF6]MCZ0960644.1 hypothetical protein [Paracoccus sp. EF6]
MIASSDGATLSITRSPSRRLALTGALLVLVLAGLWGRMMDFGLRRDETLFVPPAELLGQMSLYGDFFYNHLPYSAWLFRLVHLALPGIGLLEAGRIAVFLGWLLLVLGGGTLLWLISRSMVVALFGVLALICSDVLLEQAGMAATNNLLPLAFAFVGLGLFTWQVIEERCNSGLLFLSGLSVAIALGMKVSAVAFVPALVVAAFLLPRSLPMAIRLRHVTLPVMLGGILGTLPLFWLLATQPDLFLAHVLGFHTGPHVAYWRDHMADEPNLVLGLGDKLRLAYTVWLRGSALLLVFAAMLAGWLALSRKDARDARAAGPAIMLGAVLLFCVALSFLPTPAFPQYYIQPLICLPLLIAVLARDTVGRSGQLETAAGVAAALCLLLAFPRLADGLMALRHPDETVVSKAHRAGQQLADVLADAGHAGERVLALNPVYPLEGGLPVYPEFATGPFAYRIADYTPPGLRAHYRMTGPGEITAFLQADMPAAILTGFDGTLEEPLVQFAQANGYRRTELTEISDRYGTGVLFIRP